MKRNLLFMKFKFLLFFAIIGCLQSFAQNSQKVLFTVDDEIVYSDEFLAVYNKNHGLIADSEQDDIESYLDLYVAYKLKVKEAKELKLDTFQKFKNELSQYKRSLVAPYLRDESVTDKLVVEAYDRMKLEVNASHILMFVKPDAAPQDTIAAYNKIAEARAKIIAGESFETIAKQYSQDQSVSQNGGKLGYFSVMQMVYPFENAAYTTPIGEVSMPFRTKFGFHILKVNDIRVSKGEVEVAHIMVNNATTNAQQKIDSIYNLLETKNGNFEELAKELSDDRASAPNGGKLKKFKSGQMLDEFADIAFSLTEVGDISKPFQTKYGWHIIKLIQKYPIQSFDLIKEDLLVQVEKEERAHLIAQSVIDRLYKDYKVVVIEESYKQFTVNEDWKTQPEKFNHTILKIDEKSIPQTKFMTFLKTVKQTPVEKAFPAFKDQELIRYYTDNIELSNKEFAATFKEFKEGMLLFEMLEKQVWEKSKDSVGLDNYYKTFKSEKYKDKDLENNRGVIISDYQTYLEKEWIKELEQKYTVKINKSEKKYLINSSKK